MGNDIRGSLRVVGPHGDMVRFRESVKVDEGHVSCEWFYPKEGCCDCDFESTFGIGVGSPEWVYEGVKRLSRENPNLIFELQYLILYSWREGILVMQNGETLTEEHRDMDTSWRYGPDEAEDWAEVGLSPGRKAEVTNPENDVGQAPQEG